MKQNSRREGRQLELVIVLGSEWKQEKISCTQTFLQLLAKKWLRRNVWHRLIGKGSANAFGVSVGVHFK